MMMLSAERRKFILNVLKRDGRIVAPALSAELGVSIDTIRRDLRDLAAEGRLQRVHGGALPASPAVTSFTDRQRHLTPAKISVAARAAQLVRDGMVIVMGGGITNVQTAQHFPLDLSATVITHNPAVAVALAEHSNIEVILVGGRLFKYTMVTVGAETVDAFHRTRADLCFLGVCSLHPEVGISNVHYEEALIQRAMIDCSAEVIALASSEKLGTAAPFVIGPLSELNLIVTDQGISQDALAPYKAFDIEIIQA
ncbi:MAG TPA: DeoR/GlpR family DNA-binding transcription regulator [Anaerolineaceae bacterium]|nr:DeoR/GlpR family DNA-binding transcription regulator [Anaerolineaceae bacterium]